MEIHESTYLYFSSHSDSLREMVGAKSILDISIEQRGFEYEATFRIDEKIIETIFEYHKSRDWVLLDALIFIDDQEHLFVAHPVEMVDMVENIVRATGILSLKEIKTPNIKTPPQPHS